MKPYVCGEGIAKLSTVSCGRIRFQHQTTRFNQNKLDFNVCSPQIIVSFVVYFTSKLSFIVDNIIHNIITICDLEVTFTSILRQVTFPSHIFTIDKIKIYICMPIDAVSMSGNACGRVYFSKENKKIRYPEVKKATSYLVFSLFQGFGTCMTSLARSLRIVSTVK